MDPTYVPLRPALLHLWLVGFVCCVFYAWLKVINYPLGRVYFEKFISCSVASNRNSAWSSAASVWINHSLDPLFNCWTVSRLIRQSTKVLLLGLSATVLLSVVSVMNVSFVRTNLLSEQCEQNHFMNWFVPFSVQLSSAASMPAGSGTAVTHTENCQDVIHIRAVIRSWFANLLHTENWHWGRDSRSRTVLKVALCHSLTQGRGADSRSVTVLLKLALCC